MTAQRRRCSLLAWRVAARLRYDSGMRIGWALSCALVLAFALAACKGDDVTLGSQCSSGSSGRATLAPGAEPSVVYGTSCAPCNPDDVQLDPRGCPVLVTWESCGGAICIGGDLLPAPVADAGPSDGGDAGDAAVDGGDASVAVDASAATDASATDEDAGGTP